MDRMLVDSVSTDGVVFSFDVALSRGTGISVETVESKVDILRVTLHCIVYFDRSSRCVCKQLHLDDG